MKLGPITQKKANAHIKEHHRHNDPVTGWICGVGLYEADRLDGVLVVGRPTSRIIQARGDTVEITRLCLSVQGNNRASRLYGVGKRLGALLGYSKAISYTLLSEPGTSLRAAGFQPVAETDGGSWDRRKRRRSDKAPTCPKVRWEADLCAS